VTTLIHHSKMYCKHMAYMSSKLMQVISAKDLNARFKADHIPVRVYSLHPGVVDSDLYNNVPIIKMFHCLLKPFFKVRTFKYVDICNQCLVESSMKVDFNSF